MLGAVIVLAAVPANAQNSNQTNAQAGLTQLSQRVFHDDAHRKAAEWVANQPDRVAVAIRLGGATTFTPDDIERVINHDFTKNGVDNAVFFWEHGINTGGTGISIETDKAIFGPYSLGEIRQKVPDIAARIKFNNKIVLGSPASLN